MPAASGPLPFHYRVYGLTMSADRPLEYLAGVAVGEPASIDLSYTERVSLPLPPGWSEATPVYVSPLRDQDGRSLLRIFRSGDFDVLAFAGVADYLLSPSRIVCCLCPGAAPAIVEAHLLSSVLAFWLEGRGRVCLHASAVAIGERAIAVMSPSGGGKSSIASALVRAGHRFLTDDIAAIEQGESGWYVHQGFPVVRMWPDAARVLVGGVDTLPLVGDGSRKRRVSVEGAWPGMFAAGGSAPCRALVIAGRRHERERSTAVDVNPVGGKEAVVELVRHSFVGRLVGAAGLPANRLVRLGDLVERVPMFCLSYPSGYAHLPAVARAIEQLAASDDVRDP